MKRRPSLILTTPLVLTLVVSAALPLWFVGGEARRGGPPLGVSGHDAAFLSRLIGGTLLTAVPATVLSTALAVACTALATFNAPFRRFYRRWLVALLLTNPILLVFGFAVVLGRLPPVLAVIVASAYLVLPTTGLIVDSAARTVPRNVIDAARCLGASPWQVICQHLLPAIRPAAAGAILLGGASALGFFLAPRYVGLGQVQTLATIVVDVGPRMGDWPAAAQWSLLLEGLVVLLAVGVSGLLIDRARRRSWSSFFKALRKEAI